MARILIVYGSTEGQTAQIADRMAAVIRNEGKEVELHDANEVRKQAVTGVFDGIIVAGSVHVGDYQSSLREFVQRNRDLLERVPSAFVSVSLTAADRDAKAEAELQATLEKFIRKTGWRPRQVEHVGGALVYTRYNWLLRHIMKLIMKRQGHTELDTRRDYSFTDWDAVERFAREFAARISGEVRVEVRPAA
jgi:menaquinone-dependent protoporphyrinogen oxidase